jgi:hypothetical protein
MVMAGGTKYEGHPNRNGCLLGSVAVVVAVPLKEQVAPVLAFFW